MLTNKTSILLCFVAEKKDSELLPYGYFSESYKYTN